MEPYVILTLKLYEAKDLECEIQWAAISTVEHRSKLIEALANALEIEKRIAGAHGTGA